MREIKFRAWDKKNKIMWNITELNWRTPSQRGSIFYKRGVFGNNEQSIGADEKYVPMKDVILMQYTGLKDEKGKEGYHKDIVQMGPFIYTIEWDNRVAKFYLQAINRLDTIKYSMTHLKGAEIIGSVHSNPELLTKRNQNAKET